MSKDVVGNTLEVGDEVVVSIIPGGILSILTVFHITPQGACVGSDKDLIGINVTSDQMYKLS
jgi:hypothetical protein